MSTTKDYSSDEILRRKVFVGGLPAWVLEPQLNANFSRFGGVECVYVLRDVNYNPPRSKGCGFVTFVDAEIARKVIQKRKVLVDGQVANVHPAIKSATALEKQVGDQTRSSEKNCQAFIGGLDPAVTREDIVQVFSVYGKVVNTYMPINPATGKHRRYAFVTFDTEEALTQALQVKHHAIKGRQTDCKIAIPRKMAPSPAQSIVRSIADVLSSLNVPVVPPAAQLPVPIAYHHPFQQLMMMPTQNPVLSNMAVNMRLGGHPLRYTPYPIPRLYDTSVAAANNMGASGIPGSGLQFHVLEEKTVTNVQVRPTYVGPNPNFQNSFSQAAPFASQNLQRFNYGLYESLSMVPQSQTFSQFVYPPLPPPQHENTPNKVTRPILD